MNIQDKINEAVFRWKLHHPAVIYETPDRAVYQAESDTWGSVIVKINLHGRLLAHEAAVLGVMKANCCSVYAYEEDTGILVEERILPGVVLREEENTDVRLEVFARVFEELHPEGSARVPESETYLDWLEKAGQFCENGLESGSKQVQSALQESGLAEKIRWACEIGAEMFARYPERVLLHGDLHHDNILQKEDGSYGVIDPKGVMGPEIFDLPRFVLNELGYVEEQGVEESGKHLEQVMQKLSVRLLFPLTDIRKLVCMEMILASVWNVEDGEEIDGMLLQLVDWLLSV